MFTCYAILVTRLHCVLGAAVGGDNKARKPMINNVLAGAQMYKPKRGMQTHQKLTIAIHMHISRCQGADSMVSKGHHTLACMQQRSCRQSGLACKGMSSYRATLPVAS